MSRMLYNFSRKNRFRALHYILLSLTTNPDYIALRIKDRRDFGYNYKNISGSFIQPTSSREKYTEYTIDAIYGRIWVRKYPTKETAYYGATVFKCYGASYEG